MPSVHSSNANIRLRAPVLLPDSADDTFTFIPDAALLTNDDGILTHLGPFASAPTQEGFTSYPLIIPPLLDCHIHIPQNPIRGRFIEGIRGNEPEGPLLAGLARNVFPAEGNCADLEYASEVTRRFLADTRSTGTLGGVAYMTSHPVAARAALQILPSSWRVGLVLMDQNCPTGLQITPGEATTSLTSLARDFGQRLVVTDRFAVACSSRLRQAGVAVANQFGLNTQTHLAEQRGELATIRRLYPHAPHYTGVYENDGLLQAGREGGGSLLAHCIHLSDPEWELLARYNARIAHCPISNTELHSGLMSLDKVYGHGLDYAICTDVGASPSTSLLVEASHFLAVHSGRSSHATPSTALYRITAAAKRLGQLSIGGLSLDQPFAAVAIDTSPITQSLPDDIIRHHLLATGPIPTLQQQLESKILHTWC